MVTAADPRRFASGDALRNRTTEIQLWARDSRRSAAVYCDFAGSDDRDQELREVASLCRDILDVIIFVVPITAQRGQGRKKFIREIADYLLQREKSKDFRPFLILAAKVDQLSFNRSKRPSMRISKQADNNW
ncbi:P-loop containing nucleoside triphosphate hydrolase [Ceraceosorus bombacis]|uniref:p-loop containing nucleoside triphosphate hydrolase n=1 Tax=Ceraceosorus bombacis TaxID=401625 RepID=A0A0P1BPQ6_9BASI|nr:P-loop containing nucleoside triphosphate hydrolase [Ceraceosorus bombacis]